MPSKYFHPSSRLRKRNGEMLREQCRLEGDVDIHVAADPNGKLHDDRDAARG
jgi:hypothetical protein